MEPINYIKMVICAIIFIINKIHAYNILIICMNVKYVEIIHIWIVVIKYVKVYLEL